MMSGPDLCIHGNPIEAYCVACERERASVADRTPMRPPPMRFDRNDLVAIMATIMVANPDGGYSNFGDAIGDASMLYDAAHTNDGA